MTAWDDFMRNVDLCPRCAGVGIDPGDPPDEHRTAKGSSLNEHMPCIRCGGSGEIAAEGAPIRVGEPAPSAEPILSVCPNCGEVAKRDPYDIGSGPELSCVDCEWCWGMEGQELKPLVSPGAHVTVRALAAHRDGRQVSLNHETGEWTIDGEVIHTRPFSELTDKMNKPEE